MPFRSKHGKCATPNVIVKLHTTQDIYFLTVAAAFMPDIGDALGQLMMDKLMDRTRDLDIEPSNDEGDFQLSWAVDQNDWHDQTPSAVIKFLYRLSKHSRMLLHEVNAITAYMRTNHPLKFNY